MNTIPITGYNKKALINIKKHLEFYDWEKEPVFQPITFSSFSDLNNTIFSLLDAIETIGYNGEKTDLGTCANLACLAKKMLPSEPMEFLDSLLVKDKNNKQEFETIENLQK